MLLQFNFENFKSFRDSSTLDLTATEIAKYDNHIVKVGGEGVLPVAAIFGANASGKSNVIEAFKYMNDYIIKSFNYGGKDKKSKTSFNRPTPFIFDTKSKDTKSSFEVYFIDLNNQSEKTYQYGFTIDDTGVCEEWLNYKAKNSEEFKSIFYRNAIELDLSGLPINLHDNIISSLEKETLVVSLGSKLKMIELRVVRDWFYRNTFNDFNPSIKVPKGFATDEKVRKNVVSYLSVFDPSIIDFEVETIETGNSNNDHLEIDAIHRMSDEKGIAKIPLKNESAGTLKMFNLYSSLNLVIKDGGIMILDELDSSIHPLLLRNIIQVFLNPEINTKHSQLIFTSHDSWLLDAILLRSDEIWFTEKTRDGVSKLYSLADFINEDENYKNDYLLGKYGAIPNLKHFNMFNNK